MQVFENPAPQVWKELLQRPVFDNTGLQATVQNILKEVKLNGDAAIRSFTLSLDKVLLEDIAVQEAEIASASFKIKPELKNAIQVAANNITLFHEKQLQPVEKIETMPGVVCWRKSVPIDKVGLYIPGGSAPLFSTLLMLAIPAKIAGCKEIVLCTPPRKDGTVNEVILYTASLLGIKKVFSIGGVQAIGAMAYGTNTIPQVYKIFGPGNQYVTAAKQLIQQEGVAIDMPAGPSEVCVLADETANAAFIAADLLSQAEHGPDSQVMLVTTHASLVTLVLEEIEKQLKMLPRKTLAKKSLDNSKCIVLQKMEEAIAFVNAYAAEHLILHCRQPELIAEQITNAGSVFLGVFSPESVGDYASGTNHTLPTNGFAKAYSGVSVDSFVKKITYQQLTQDGLALIGPSVALMAAAEG
ncbi:MAG: histidinol dehydrogenase, partial [Hydrotalea flava]|nr:histidinol dehydrogenase [Hydrotalea flava]NIM38513.1 histidinol dehydrogenase [Hydrotalea flava]NIN03665.1 histidinol dehydrogenase [Hydrotalea flava]NIN15370.1 histidinol dehydrogenase [Hydrotalea flava]NIO94439.1 histidinol dehydrogenase [Hydrotalea flava]